MDADENVLAVEGMRYLRGRIVLQSGERSENPYSEPILNGERLRAAARARRAFVGTSL